jgi:hypothetical protein
MEQVYSPKSDIDITIERSSFSLDTKLAKKFYPTRTNGFHIKFEDKTFLLSNSGSKTRLCCNDISAMIWSICDGESTLEEIINLLHGHFNVPVSTIEPEVVHTLETFQKYGAIRFTQHSRKKKI